MADSFKFPVCFGVVRRNVSNILMADSLKFPVYLGVERRNAAVKIYAHIIVIFKKKYGSHTAPSVLLIFSISVPNVVTIRRHITSFVTCATLTAYLKNWTDNFFQIFFMGASWVAVSINDITTRASREMMSRKNIKIFDFIGVNVKSKSKSKKCLFIVDKNTTRTLVADTIKST